MSARYAAGFSVSGVNTANTQVANLVQTGTAQRIDVLQVIVGISSAPTTAPSFYLTRTTARGTQSTSVTGQQFDAADQTPTATVDTAWTVAPTFVTTAQMTRAGLATTAGGYWVWDFRDYPITIDKTAGLGLAIVNANASGATTGTFAGSFIWEE